MMQLFNARDYLKIDIANNFGLDKEDWDVRIAWFNEHEHELDALVNKADNPALFFAGVNAYKDMLNGKPIGYPISLDATSSGIQISSVLIGCRKSASICNMVDTGKRMDAYTANYESMLNLIGDTARIDRKDTKRALMTAMYSSKAIPREVFGEGTPLLKAFYDSVKELMPGAWELNEALLGTWQKNALSHDWVLPDNFHVKIKVMGSVINTVHFMNAPVEVRTTANMPMEEGRSNGANIHHSIDGMIVREITNRCGLEPEKKQELRRIATLKHGGSVNREEDKMVLTLWDHYTKSGFLSSRILNYIDPLNAGHVDYSVIVEMLETLPDNTFPVMATHDCFRVHPNNGNNIRNQYNQIMYEIAKSNLLEFIVSQIVGYTVRVDKIDDIAEEVLNANYALS